MYITWYGGCGYGMGYAKLPKYAYANDNYYHSAIDSR